MRVYLYISINGYPRRSVVDLPDDQARVIIDSGLGHEVAGDVVVEPPKQEAPKPKPATKPKPKPKAKPKVKAEDPPVALDSGESDMGSVEKQTVEKDD